MQIRSYIQLLLVSVLLIACNPKPPIDLKVQKIVLSDTVISIAEGDSMKIGVTFLPTGASENTTWTTSNPKVATVSANGTVKALSRGFALIKAQGDSLHADCQVTVTRNDLPYQLVWADEFEGNSLNTDHWTIETGGGGWGNQEKQYYTGRTENLRIENGILLIEAKKEIYQSHSYTSARINTKDKKSFKYGKIEARINLPAGKGTWPAFWMLGANFASARWPLCGEIDIMEHIGSKPTMISHAVHTSEKNGSKGNNWYSQKTVSDAENNFHVYGIEWEERANEGDDAIHFTIDGVKTATIWEPHVDATIQKWPFKQEFFIILNLAMGGTMGGTIEDAIFENPVILKIDYVRVYQRK